MHKLSIFLHVMAICFVKCAHTKFTHPFVFSSISLFFIALIACFFLHSIKLLHFDVFISIR